MTTKLISSPLVGDRAAPSPEGDKGEGEGSK
jgi:hypothetical protein